MPRPSPEDIKKQQIKLEYETTTATSKELAERYKVKDATIRSWISRDKWVKPDELKQAKESKKKSVVATKKNDLRNNVAEVKKDVSKKVKNQIIDDVESNNELNEKERLFCLYYASDPNVLQAYLKAYKCKYETARVEAYKLMNKPSIRKEITRLKQIKYQSILLEANDIVERHMRIAFSSLTNFAEFGRTQVPVMGPFGPVKVEGAGGEKETLMKEVNDVRFRDWTEVDGSVIKSVKVGKDGASIELYDAQKSMEWLEKFFGWNPMDTHKMEFDRRRLELQEKELAIKSKTGSVIQEAIVDAQVQVQNLANLINGACPNRSLEQFEASSQKTGVKP
jgi:phage terminase small subunit